MGRSVMIKHDGFTFGFSRDQFGQGYWHCLSIGRTPYSFGTGAVVPTIHWKDLHKTAISQGFSNDDLRISAPQKEETSRGVKIITSDEDKPVRRAKTKSTDSGIKIFG